MRTLHCSWLRHIHVAGVLALVGLQLLHSHPAAAQDQPMVFIHGLQNNGNAWAPTASDLTSQFQITPLYPTLGWRDPLATQEARLDAALAGRGGMPALGHSNGGLIGRHHVQRRGAATRIDRLATIGSAHRGAPIASSALNGDLARYYQQLIGAVADPVNFYATYDPDWYAARTWGIRSAAHNLYRFANFAPFGALVALGLQQGVPVLTDDVPGSAFLTGLNSAGGMAAEQAYLRSRVGIGTIAYPYDIQFQLLTSSNWRTWAKVRRAAHSYAKAMERYYRGHPDYFLAANAWRWEWMAIRVLDMDLAWLNLAGVVGGYVCSSNFCYGQLLDHSDGIVPFNSQQYPGATVQLNVPTSRAWLTHVQQKNHWESRQEFRYVLRSIFHVPDRPPPPGPGGPGPCVPDPPHVHCPL